MRRASPDGCLPASQLEQTATRPRCPSRPPQPTHHRPCPRPRVAVDRRPNRCPRHPSPPLPSARLFQTAPRIGWPMESGRAWPPSVFVCRLTASHLIAPPGFWPVSVCHWPLTLAEPAARSASGRPSGLPTPALSFHLRFYTSPCSLCLPCSRNSHPFQPFAFLPASIPTFTYIPSICSAASFSRLLLYAMDAATVELVSGLAS